MAKQVYSAAIPSLEGFNERNKDGQRKALGYIFRILLDPNTSVQQKCKPAKLVEGYAKATKLTPQELRELEESVRQEVLDEVHDMIPAGCTGGMVADEA